MYINLSDGVQTPGPRKIDSKFVVTPWPSSSSSGIDFNESLSHPRILFLRQTFFFFFKFKRDAFFSFNFFLGGGEGKEKSQRQTSRRRGLFPTKGHKHSSASVRKKKKKKKERKARWSQQFCLKLLRIHRFVIATIWLPPRCTGKSNAFVVKVGGFKIPSRL